MTEPKTKKLSRRDAIKILGAVASASVLANLPTKWSKPRLTQGVLPAHAQTSSLGLTILSCTLIVNISDGSWSSSPSVVPIPIPLFIFAMKFTLTLVNAHFISGDPNPYTTSWDLDTTTGQTIYVNSGNIVLSGPIALDAPTGSMSVLWEFPGPSYGTGTCSQTVSWTP